MLQSKLFSKTEKLVSQKVTFLSHRLLLQGGFIYPVASGIYTLLPLGWKVFERIENIIREEFEKIGVQEVSMPVLHPAEIWQKSGRLKSIGKELWRIKDRRGREMILAMTNEEMVSQLAATFIHSAVDLPCIVNQIKTKIRDEERPRGGLLRVREFVMQDAYSFDKDNKGLDKSFNLMLGAYKRIFQRVGLKAIPVKAASGMMGGSDSFEFMVLAECGEDKVTVCPHCDFKANIELLGARKRCPVCGHLLEIKKSIEVAHVFKLGEKYSKIFGIKYKDSKKKEKLVQMGCYGIGLERLIGTIVEKHHDHKGIIWPSTVSPFAVHLLSLRGHKKEAGRRLERESNKIYHILQKAGFSVLYDDRDNKTPGEKFADADLIGIPLRIVVSEKTMQHHSVGVKKRDAQGEKLVPSQKIVPFLRKS